MQYDENLTSERPSFVSHLECAATGERHAADEVHNLSRAGKPQQHAPRWENAQTVASGIRVPQAIGDFLILRAVRESGGFAIAVSDEMIAAALDVSHTFDLGLPRSVRLDSGCLSQDTRTGFRWDRA